MNKRASLNSTQALSDLSEEISLQFAYPNSTKHYIQGSRDDIRVPLRLIEQDPTITAAGEELNPPIPVYDTSGPYGDSAQGIDLKEGLPNIRERWIEERGDTEKLPGLSLSLIHI